MIHIPDKQKDIILPIIQDFFPEGSKSYYNNYTYAYNVVSVKEKAKNYKATKYIELQYQSSVVKTNDTPITDMRSIDGDHAVKYAFYIHNGSLCEVRYSTKINGWLHSGRLSDGLASQQYTDGFITYESYRDAYTSKLHNEKGHAEFYIDSEGNHQKLYYINGEYIGTNLPVGDNAELYLKNYRML